MTRLDRTRSLTAVVLSLCLLLGSSASDAAMGHCPVSSIFAGRDFALTLGADGALAGWGVNVGNQLGYPRGTFAMDLALGPVPLPSLPPIVTAAAGHNHGLAIDAAGTVWVWGRNNEGQLGNGTNDDGITPQPLMSLPPMVAVAGGRRHTLALDSTGQVWAWGENFQGQLGDGTDIDSNVPVMVVGMNDAVAIDAGGATSFAIRADGSLWAWGDNWNNGALGDGTFTDRWTPVATWNPASVVAVAASGGHTLALLSDGRVRAWGANHFGELGFGRSDPGTPFPTDIPTLSNVTAIDAFGMSMALTSDGRVWAWGYNGAGQQCNGGTADSNEPQEVTAIGPAMAMAVGGAVSISQKMDGTVWACGWNGLGGLGNYDFTFTDSAVPVPVGFDTLPPEQGNVLKATKDATWSDVVLTFPKAPAPMSWELYADPSILLVGTTAIGQASTTSFVDVGAVGRSNDDYYVVKGLSFCSGLPGP